MAQWSRADKTLFTKLVYYGPAFGGKTTNLETLHRITDPQGQNQLLNLKTASDRTLFFDLLPFELGEILGYQVGMKLYTVPGQVRYDTTRQVVLSGADAIIFVADSSEGRAEQNRWSLQNLKMNMRAKRLDPARVPVVFQFNKRDLPDAADPETIARWLGIPGASGVEAIATQGHGVLETFIGATRAMLKSLIASADDKTRYAIDVSQLDEQLDRAFAPCMARRSAGEPQVHGGNTLPVTFEGEDLLEDSLKATVDLGEQLAESRAREQRLEDEAEALRRLSEALRRDGASFDPRQIVDTALAAAKATLPAAVVSLVRRVPGKGFAVNRVIGRKKEPLLATADGRRAMTGMSGRPGAATIGELGRYVKDGGEEIAGLRAALAVPVDSDEQRLMIAYAAEDDRPFRPEDERFLITLAGHLAVGLEKARLYSRLADRGKELESLVDERASQLSRAYEELRQLDELKHRFLTNVSHEMRSPLTAILTSAVMLRDYKPDAEQSAEMVEGIVGSGQALNALLDNLFRLVEMERQDISLEIAPTRSRQLVEEAVRLSGLDVSRVVCSGESIELRADGPRVGRALANLIDNAGKFSGADMPVEIRVEASRLAERPALSISVCDRGCGVAPGDRRRMFDPLEQGGDIDTGKPRGVGLGLHEARVIVERHGGAIEYRPRDGGGSQFRVVLPVEATDAQEATHETR